MLHITEEQYTKGSYHYYFDWHAHGMPTTLTFDVLWSDRRSARRALRKRYPFLNDIEIKFITK